MPARELRGRRPPPKRALRIFPKARRRPTVVEYRQIAKSIIWLSYFSVTILGGKGAATP